VCNLCTGNVLDFGELYTWGSNSFGQLGQPHVQHKANTPERVPQEVNIYVWLSVVYIPVLGFC